MDKKVIASWKRRGYYRPSVLRNRINDVKKRFYEGLCHKCHALPAYKVLHPMDGISLVEFW